MPTDSFTIAPAVTLKQASLRYGEQILFAHLDLVLPAGQWTVILGPSGVGKTSLLRLIAGLSSDAHVETSVIASDKIALAGRMSYLPQHDFLLPWLSVFNNVLISTRLAGHKIDCDLKQRAQALLQQAGLGKAINQYPQQLSGGMRQRVAIVRTILEDRPVVLMDEPFSALDVITRLQLQDLAADFLSNRTVLLVTHDPLEALRLGHIIYVMSGRPATLGEPLKPAGKTPRPPSEPSLLTLQGQLLERLVKAREIT